MRCLACNTILTDIEATRKFERSGTFVDLCNDCFSTIADDVDVQENETLSDNLNDLEDDDERIPKA